MSRTTLPVAQIAQYVCRECGFSGEQKVVNGLIECPSCGTKNDVWIEGEQVPHRHKQLAISPFSGQEEVVMNLLVQAHNNFINLEGNRSDDVKAWVESLHRLQDLMGARALRRMYPNYFRQ